MANEHVITIKDRKLFYDDYNRGFYFETKIEALERATANNYKKAEALNKNISLQCESINRHIDQAEHIFTSKTTREIAGLRESLRGHVAYRKILTQCARDFDLSPKNKPYGKYGTYGPNGNQKEALPYVDSELKQMNPESRRRKEVKRLLRQRKKPEVLDKTHLDELFIAPPKTSKPETHATRCLDMTNVAQTQPGLKWDSEAVGYENNAVLRRQESMNENQTEGEKPEDAGKLVLPPIQVSLSMPAKSKSMPIERDSKLLHLPSVFVTELDKREEDETGKFVLDTGVESDMDIS